jgi:hypothetical protein
MAIGWSTYQDVSIREDLLSILKDVSPLDGNYLVANLGKSTATQRNHEWVTFYTARPTAVTFKAEGFDASVVDLTGPVRSNNYTAIISEVIQVTGSERVMNTALNIDPYTFQKNEALKRMNATMEYALLNGSSKSSGASGTARSMLGIDGCITTNVSAYSNATMSMTVVEDILQSSWNKVGASYVADTIITTMTLKRKFSTFGTYVTNFANNTNRLFGNVSTFEAATGVVNIVPHKDVATAKLYALKMDTFKMAFLQGREPQFVELAKTGDADKGMYVTEMTLESLAEPASVKISGLTN